jgi:hypothetical protein
MFIGWSYRRFLFLYPHSPKGEGVYCFTSVRLSVLPSVQDIFRHTFLSNCWWQRSDIWSQLHIGTPYRGKHFWTHQIPTSCLPTLLIFIHIEHIWSFFIAFFSATIDGRDLIFGHKLHIGTPYRGKRFWTHQIPTSCLPTLLIFMHIEHICSFFVIFLSNYWWQESDIWSQASYRYAILWEAFLEPSDSYFLFADLVGFYTHWTYMIISTFFVTFFSATIDGRDLIFGHKLHIGTTYRAKRFWTHQIPTSCLSKSGGIISEH